MLQRSPGYIVSMDNSTPPMLKKLLPETLLYQFLRLWFMTSLFIQFQFCRNFPEVAKRKLKEDTKRQLPSDVDINPHFTPNYDPWQQRLCLSPNGDFFACLRAGTASVVTGKIQGFTNRTILLQHGEKIEDVDILVTATGLKVIFAGKIQISVNSQLIDVSEKLLWRGCMLEDVPNSCFLMGYTHASWTLGADASAVLFCRLVSSMVQSQQVAVTPRFQGNAEERASVQMGSFLNLNSTYVKKAVDFLPKTGDRGPWRARSNYYFDFCTARWGNISDGLSFKKPKK